MGDSRRILLNVVATYGRSLYALVIGLFCGRWTLMALGEVDYGLFGVVGGLTAFIGFFNGILAGSISRFYAFSVGAAQRSGNGDAGLEECRRWFSVAVSVHTVVPVALMAVGYPIGAYAVEHWLTIPADRVRDCVWVFRFVCLTCFLGMAGVPFNAMYNAKQLIAELTVYSFATATLNVVFLYYMITHPGVWLAKFALWTCILSAVPSLVVACRAAVCFPECRIRRKHLWNLADIRELASFAGWNLFGAIGNLFKGAGMTVLVNKFFGPVQNAAVSIASTVAGHSQSLAGSMVGALMPAITNARGAEDRPRMTALVHRTCKFGALLVLPFALPLALEIDEVMVLWLGNPPAQAGVLCIWMMAVLVLENMTTGLWVAISANGKIARYQLAVGTLFILTLPLAWLMMRCGLGLCSVGYALFTTLSAAACVRIAAVKILLGMSPRYWVLRIFLPLVLLSATACAIGTLPRFFMAESPGRLCVTTFLVEIVLVPLAWTILLERSEREFLTSKFAAGLAKLREGRRMPELAGHLKCTGCAACQLACPHGAIRMRPDKEGFAFPEVEAALCVECGLCERKCPVRMARKRDASPMCYAAKSNDDRLVSESSSGGLFSEFALSVLGRGGVVFGAAYVGEHLDVRHIALESADDLRELRGSKYVQSEVGGSYCRAKEALECGRSVLFSGTPCQIAGLKAYLGKDHDKLLTVEVICHGVPSPKLFDELKWEMASRHGMLRAISFRDKSEGWSSRAMTGWYASGEKIRERGDLNDYFKAFIAHLTLRHSCEDCQFNDGRSEADITLGDFWGVESVLPGLGDNTGVSAVILHTEKGVAEFERLRCRKHKVCLCDIARGNPSYQAPRGADKNRNAFMSLALDGGMHTAARKYLCEPHSSFLRRLMRGLRKQITAFG